MQILPTKMAPGSTAMEIDAGHWSARGFDLKTLIAQVWDVDVRRVDLADEAAASARYDVTLALPEEKNPEATQRLLREAIENKFRLTITAEHRLMEVYVLTAPNGPGPALRRHGTAMRAATGGPVLKLTSLEEPEPATDDAQQITYEGKNCSGVAASGIAAAAASIAEFRRTLEPDLDRLLVDETNLDGSYDFRIGSYGSQQELFRLMREQLGLVVAAEQRSVTVLAVRAS
ncbi:MAG: TIGR03435 family protein [Acidobacteriaceae bacterium]